MMGIVTRNFGWKVASLGTALLIWMALSGSQESTMSLTSPVQYTGIPKNLEISSGMVEEAHIVLRGPSVKLTRLKNSELPVMLDLGRIQKPGETTFTLTKDNLDLPSGVSLERAIPSQIRMKLETRAAKAAPVHVRFENMPPGMMIAEQAVTPPSLTIMGPESNIRGIEVVETDPVDLRLLDANGEARTTAFAGDPKVVFDGSPIVTVRMVLQPIHAEPVTSGKPGAKPRAKKE